MTYTVFTDGACSNNPGPGGWGLIMKTPDGRVIEAGGREDHSTNNRMELTALLETLKRLTIPSQRVVVHSDSAYCINGITQWRLGWRRQGWVNSSGAKVANLELWQEMDSLIRAIEAKGDYQLVWLHVKAHVGIPGNERADTIATSFAANDPTPLYDGAAEDYTVSFDVPVSKPAGTRTKSSSKKPIGYVSCVEGKFYFDRTWPECESRVKGRSNVRFKKVFSELERDSLRRKWLG